MCGGSRCCCGVRRHTLGRGVTAGVVFFVAALSPLLGFIPLYTFRYSFVADHYQYLACAGLMAPCRYVIESRGEGTFRALFLGFLSTELLVVLGLLTWKQSQVYADEKTLWRDTLAKNPASWMAHNNLGYVYLTERRLDEAVFENRKALVLKPDLAQAYYDIGAVFVLRGRTDEAIAQYRKALEIAPNYAAAHADLGCALLQKGLTNEAIVQYDMAVMLKPGYAVAERGLAFLLDNAGRSQEAVIHYETAVKVEPQDGWTQHGLGLALLNAGRAVDAISPLLKAVEAEPSNAQYKNDLGQALFSMVMRQAASRVFFWWHTTTPPGLDIFSTPCILTPIMSP